MPNGTKKRIRKSAGTGRKKAADASSDKKKYRRRQTYAIILFAAALLMAAFVFFPGVHLWTKIHDFFFGMLGPCALLCPPLMVYLAVKLAFGKPEASTAAKLAQMVAFVFLLCGLIQIFTYGSFPGIQRLYESGISISSGGVVGGAVGGPLCQLFGKTGAAIIVILLILVLFLLLTGITLLQIFSGASRLRQKQKKAKIPADAPNTEDKDASGRLKRPYNIDVDLGPDKLIDTPPDIPEKKKEKPQKADAASQSGLDDLVKKIARMKEPEPLKIKNEAAAFAAPEPAVPVQTVEGQQIMYHYPPATLLKGGQALPNEDVADELKANAGRLVDTLRSFGVETRITDISRGPAVTRYELQPSAGVKISRITSLADDIALNLAAAGVRIEAPIPNKAAVGIEVPNKTVSVVHIREIIDSPEFRDAKSRLTIALGRDIAGNAAVADVSKMPHMLIAGATGSGKSVCINSIIISLLYKSTPDEVKFLMVDPKVVELGVYNGIPHLLVPVVTDPRKAAGALGWAVTEMLNRYKTFADNNVRDIRGFNAIAKKTEGLTPMPQVVIIIDELADLMMAAPNDVEDAICRLAQMARAAGMHLVIATQRPSVDVITGVIKANIPSRIAFAVSSQVDSRTILDSGGAEKLLGRGDMLFLPVGASKPTRIQGCFVTDEEVETVINYIKSGSAASYDEDVMDEIEKQSAKEKSEEPQSKGDEADAMLPQAIECVIDAGVASTSLLQRRLKLGYARAARIVDEMEARGIVGPFEGSKPRQVLMTRQQWMEMTMSHDEE